MKKSEVKEKERGSKVRMKGGEQSKVKSKK